MINNFMLEWIKCRQYSPGKGKVTAGLNNNDTPFLEVGGAGILRSFPPGAPWTSLNGGYH